VRQRGSEEEPGQGEGKRGSTRTVGVLLHVLEDLALSCAHGDGGARVDKGGAGGGEGRGGSWARCESGRSAGSRSS